ncbi:MAG: aldose epimerase family protein [Eubacteriales bacterium]|nr:aldose epimerase family protein [Eubacteriales bacterium]
MKKELFGTVNGRDVFLYTLENSRGMKAVVSNFGALIVRIYAPDHDGSLQDVALGYETLEEYQVNGAFFGAVIAPNANRIGGASYTLDGVTYHLDKNDGENNLHSHRELGAHKRVWDAQEKDGGILFTLEIGDMEMGFGGNKKLSVLYQVTEENGLRITYDADSDKDTVINMTNHCYFNLDGQGEGSIESHRVQLFASAYTPTDAGSIPTGEIAPVAGTPMDFTVPHAVGERINDDFEQLKLAGGYDHNWACDGFDGSLRRIAVVENGAGSRTMEVYTDLPGVQFYTGNFLTPDKGKDGKHYDYRSGLALETQFYPDTPNKPQFPSSVFGPDRHYHTVTEYRFI